MKRFLENHRRFAEAVGYDLYCKMLREAVGEAKGEAAAEEFETGVDLVTDAFIPDDYIPDEAQKLDIYKRISAIQNEEDADNMIDELLDRYGDPPKSVTNLIDVAKLRAEMEFHAAGTPCFIWKKRRARMTASKTMKLCEGFVSELLKLVQ